MKHHMVLKKTTEANHFFKCTSIYGINFSSSVVLFILVLFFYAVLSMHTLVAYAYVSSYVYISSFLNVHTT